MMYKTLSLVAAVAAMFGSAQAALKPRDSAPSFTNVNAVENSAFVTKSLSDYEGKFLVVLFYPFDFTYVCPTELIAFSEQI